MQQAKRCQTINTLVQPVPARPAKAADHGICRSCRQCAKAEQGDKADGQIKAQGNFLRHQPQAPLLVCDIQNKMKHPIGKCRHAHHAAHRNQLRPVGNAPQRRDEERQNQKPDRPIAGGVNGQCQRFWLQPARQQLQCRPAGRCQHQRQSQCFEAGKPALPVQPRQKLQWNMSTHCFCPLLNAAQACSE